MLVLVTFFLVFVSTQQNSAQCSNVAQAVHDQWDAPLKSFDILALYKFDYYYYYYDARGIIVLRCRYVLRRLSACIVQ